MDEKEAKYESTAGQWKRWILGLDHRMTLPMTKTESVIDCLWEGGVGEGQRRDGTNGKKTECGIC